MSFLLDKLPTSVAIDDIEVTVNADFRVFLRIEEMREQGLDDIQRAQEALLLFYGMIPENLLEAAQRLQWFMRCGKEEELAAENAESCTARPVFSFSYDAELIYTAFLDQYHIDLITVKFLHWWAFRAMFDGLREDHLFCEIRRCRAVNIADIKDKNKKRYYREMKKRYALPLPEEEQQQLDALADALMHGGDVSKILAE